MKSENLFSFYVSAFVKFSLGSKCNNGDWLLRNPFGSLLFLL